MNNFDEILKKLPRSISDDLKLLPASVISEVEEVRLRCGRNIRLKSNFFEKAIAHIITSEELRSTLNSLIKYSFYAYEQDLANGFVTIEGGHRVGVCGKVVIKDGRPALIKEISSLNIRFAKEIKGCADKLTSEVLDDNGKVINTLIVSPPGCDKAYGIPMLIRSMAPDVIVTDEIGKTEDIRAVQQCLSTGVGLITTIHGSNLDEIESSAIGSLIREKVFKRIVFLTKEGGPGTIKEVLHA
mgnify:CR=1 FL=1